MAEFGVEEDDTCPYILASTSNTNDKYLQNIFKKLRVNNKPKKCTKIHNQLATTTQQKIFRKKDKISKKLVREPTFIFKTAEKLGEEETKISQKLEEKYLNNSVTDIQPSHNPNNVSTRVQNCGEQFRHGAGIQMNTSSVDDTTPGELAAYFDQLLHIPKPMSLMAEMMYT